MGKTDQKDPVDRKDRNLKRIIDEKIRPQLAAHGGDMEVVSLDGGVLTVRLTGRCCGCPSADITAENIIRKELKKEIPEITDVVLDNSVSEELLDFARKILGKH